MAFTGNRAINSYGSVPFNKASRYFRFRLTMEAGETWEWAIGVDDIDAIPASMR